MSRVLLAPRAPAAPIRGSSSVVGWFGTSLGASDTLVPLCPGGAIPWLSHCQAQHCQPPVTVTGSRASLGRAVSRGAACRLCLPVTSARLSRSRESRQQPVSTEGFACWLGGDSRGSGAPPPPPRELQRRSWLRFTPVGSSFCVPGVSPSSVPRVSGREGESEAGVCPARGGGTCSALRQPRGGDGLVSRGVPGAQTPAAVTPPVQIGIAPKFPFKIREPWTGLG